MNICVIKTLLKFWIIFWLEILVLKNMDILMILNTYYKIAFQKFFIGYTLRSSSKGLSLWF